MEKKCLMSLMTQDRYRNGVFYLRSIMTLYAQQYQVIRRSRLPRGLKRGSAASRLLRLWVLIPSGTWMFVYCECCVLSGRGLCGGLITRPEESYRMWCVVVCDQETSYTKRPQPRQRAAKYKPTMGSSASRKISEVLQCCNLFNSCNYTLVIVKLHTERGDCRLVESLSASAVSFLRRIISHY